MQIKILKTSLHLRRSRIRSRKSTYDLVKIKNWSRKRNQKRDGIGVGRIRTFPFLPTPLTTLSLPFRLWSSKNQIVGVGSRSGRINQSQCTFPRFVIGLVLLFLLPTPTIWFSLDHKRNVSDAIVSEIGTLFSLVLKLYASDYDSAYAASENQLLDFIGLGTLFSISELSR